MFRYYNVYVGSKHIDLVKAISEQDACNQCYMRFGSASKYSGLGLENFRAEKA
jgi:hypothetical protein